MQKLFDFLAKPFDWLAQQDLLGRILGFVFFLWWATYRCLYQFPADNSSLEALVIWWLISFQYLIFIVAYLIRRRVKAIAKGFWQTVFPLGCAVLPFALNDYGFKHSPVTRPNDLFLVFILLFIGISIQVLGAFSLRRCFSIMTEGRELVTRGIYRVIRHPMYIGSIIASAGIAWYRLSLFNAFIFITYMLCQWYRSRLEERKLTSVFPEYKDYKKRVWWL